MAPVEGLDVADGSSAVVCHGDSQWVAQEAERALALHKARSVLDASVCHLPSALPHYLRPRAAAGSPLPRVEVVAGAVQDRGARVWGRRLKRQAVRLLEAVRRHWVVQRWPEHYSTRLRYIEGDEYEDEGEEREQQQQQQGRGDHRAAPRVCCCRCPSSSSATRLRSAELSPASSPQPAWPLSSHHHHHRRHHHHHLHHRLVETRKRSPSTRPLLCEEGPWPLSGQVDEEEERGATLGFVVTELPRELYVELMLGLRGNATVLAE